MTPDELKEKCLAIQAVITDVDGVMTDGGMYYGEGGDELKKFNVRDGVGVVLLRSAGIKVGAMTGESTHLVKRRMKKIGMDFLYCGVRDKSAVLKEFLAKSGLKKENVAYIGDEINDICLLGEVGLFLAVADGCQEIRDRADYVLKTRGGRGTLREAAEIILTATGKMKESFAIYRKRCMEKAGSEKPEYIDLKEMKSPQGEV